MRVIAIDGPAGAGKSTVARGVARRLDLAYLDTGAMYRAVAFIALREAIDPGDDDAVARLADAISIEVGDRVLVEGVDATTAIRGPDVTAVVSTIAAVPAVRAAMVRRQRAWVEEHGGGVVEGRDIGTVVFPDAELKVFLTASDEERARRRQRDEAAPDVQRVASDLARRDHLDSTRAVSPLVVADDALVIDTTGRGADDVVEEIVRRLQ